MVKSEMRQKGIKMFSTVMKNEKNCSILEKNIFERCDNNETVYFWFIYQIIGFLIESHSKEVLGVHLNNIKNSKMGWESSFYDSIRSKIEEHDNYIVTPFEVVDGVVKCPKCNGNKTWSIQKQTRSSDEPMTTFSRCVTCGHNWKYSG